MKTKTINLAVFLIAVWAFQAAPLMISTMTSAWGATEPSTAEKPFSIVESPSLVEAFWKSLSSCQWSLKGKHNASHKMFDARCTPLSVDGFKGFSKAPPLEDVALKLRVKMPKHNWKEILQDITIHQIKIKHHETHLAADGTLIIDADGWIKGALTLKGRNMLRGVAKWIPQETLTPTEHLVLQATAHLLEPDQEDPQPKTIRVRFHHRKIFINSFPICNQRPIKISEGR